MAFRLFTLAEALELLPAVKQMLLDIQEKRRAMAQQSAELERLLALSGGNGHLVADQAKAREDLQVAGQELERLMSEFEQTGAELKGIDEGLIDFPSMRGERVVYLCWRQGEETISYWHETDTGFAGREPL